MKGNEPIHVKQLDSINIWLDAFRKRTLKSSEQVAFDVMGGDFNFDNISPGTRNFPLLGNWGGGVGLA